MTPPGEVDTPYGRCDAVALEALRQSFDTSVLLHDIDELNAIGVELTDPDGLRTDFLRLHAMAHTVLNGAAMAGSNRGQTLTDLSVDIETQLDELVATLRAIRSRVHPLTGLAPEWTSSHNQRIAEN